MIGSYSYGFTINSIPRVKPHGMPDYIYYKMKRYLKDRVFKQQKHKSGFAEFKNKQKEEEQAALDSEVAEVEEELTRDQVQQKTIADLKKRVEELESGMPII